MEALRRPAFRLRPGAALDSYGDPVGGWEAPQRARLKGAVIRSPESEEVVAQGASLLKDERMLYAERVLDLEATDRVEDADGVVWEVDGDPVIRYGLAGRDTTSARLKRLKVA